MYKYSFIEKITVILSVTGAILGCLFMYVGILNNALIALAGTIVFSAAVISLAIVANGKKNQD